MSHLERVDSTSNRRYRRDMLLENFLVLVVRTLFGISLSVVLAVTVFLSGVLSIDEVGALGYRIMTASTTGIGAGIGGFTGWFSRDPPLTSNLLRLVLVVITGILGALLGEQVDKTIWGAVMGANVPLVVPLWLKAIRDQ